MSYRTSKRAAKVLREARALIARPKGWVKGVSRAYRGLDSNLNMRYAYCATGAVTEAVRITGVVSGTESDRLTKSAISLGLIPEEEGIIYLNDHPSTRKKDILAVFDDAIAIAEGTAK